LPGKHRSFPVEPLFLKARRQTEQKKRDAFFIGAESKTVIPDCFVAAPIFLRSGAREQSLPDRYGRRSGRAF